MLKKIRHIPLISTCLRLLTALMLSSCINDDMVCDDDLEKGTWSDEGLVFSFSIVTRNAERGKSRALVDPANSTQIGNDAENFLDLNNITFLLFDNKQILIREFVPDVEMLPNTSYIKYEVRAALNDKFFLEPAPDADGNITFTIMVLGNYSGLGGTGFAYHPGMKLEDIFKPENVATFAMPLSNYGQYANNNEFKWIPAIGNDTPYDVPDFDFSATLSAAHIPMAGMKTYTVSAELLNNSKVNSPILLSEAADGSGDINMLRALAKIEIVDQIGIVNGVQLDKDSRIWLEKAELIGYTTRGSILPTFNQWTINGIETQYVTAPSVPDAANYLGYQPISDQWTTMGPAIQFFPDAAASESAGYPVLSCYLTEYDVDKLNGQYPMWVRITAHDPGNVDEASRPYELRLAEYDTNNIPGNNISILRNNIYRYAITGVNDHFSRSRTNNKKTEILLSYRRISFEPK